MDPPIAPSMFPGRAAEPGCAPGPGRGALDARPPPAGALSCSLMWIFQKSESHLSTQQHDQPIHETRYAVQQRFMHVSGQTLLGRTEDGVAYPANECLGKLERPLGRGKDGVESHPCPESKCLVVGVGITFLVGPMETSEGQLLLPCFLVDGPYEGVNVDALVLANDAVDGGL